MCVVNLYRVINADMHVASHHCIARHSVSYQMHLWLFYLVQNYELLLYNDIMVTILIKFQFSIFIRTMLLQFLTL